MQIDLGLTGLILQVTAGWILILDQLVHRFADAISGWLRKYTKRVFDDTRVEGRLSFGRILRSQWRMSLLMALIALAVGLILLLIYEGDTRLTFGTIIGPLMYLLISYNLYLYSLRYLAKVMGKWDPIKNRFTGNDADMTKANVLLFSFSFGALIGMSYAIIAIAEAHNLIQLAVGIPLVVI